MAAEQDDAARQFVDHLRELHRRVGNPSYATMEQASGHKLIKSTVSDILGGKRIKVPSWRFVSTFVATCHQVARDTGLDPMRLGSINGWKIAWDDAREGRLSLDFPGLDEAPPGPAKPPESAEPVGAVPAPPSAGQLQSLLEDQSTAAGADPAEPGIVRLHGPIPRGVNDFIGRADLLRDLHQVFTSDTWHGALAIQGLSGIGKTQLAIAYTQEYAAYYDLVWWISCQTRNVAYRDMANLESQLGLSHVPTSPQEPRFAAVFEALRLGTIYRRWLLVFDNADVPDDIKEFIPPGYGHVLITSRSNIWERSGQLVEVGVFARRDSVTFLRKRMRGLSEADAQRIAEAAGDLPLVLEHATVSRLPVDDYVRQLESSPVDLLSMNQPPGYPLPVAEVWQRTIAGLQGERDAVQLLRCLAFFGRDPIPLDILDKGSQLPLQPVLRETIWRNRAIVTLRHTGLLQLGSVPRTLVLHRLTQGIVRDTLTAEEAKQHRHDVHLLLAATDPRNPDDPEYWPTYGQARGHMGPSGVEGCGDGAVRRFVVNVVAYLTAAGNPAEARTLADAALDRWLAASAGDDASASDFDATAGMLAMRRVKVDALFSLGEYQDALELSEDMLDEVRADPGSWWPGEAIIAGRAEGACLRVMGKFAAALEADTQSSQKHVSGLAHNHPQTFIAMNNLAIDTILNGSYHQAAKLTEKTYLECQAFYAGGHPAVFFYQNSVARSMRFAGQYHEALVPAEAAHEGYRSAVENKILDENHPWILTHEIDLAAARRDAGHFQAAFDGFASPTRDIHQACWQAFGVDHQYTLAAAVMLGSLLRRITGRADEAAEEVAKAQRLYGATLGDDHPYTHACSTVLAGIRRQAGAPAEAVVLLEGAIAGLGSTVGESHPLTLNATAALVNALTDNGDPRTAVTRGETALEHFRRVLGPDHPETLGCAANVAAALAASRRDKDAGLLRADTLGRYRRTLGADHPSTKSFVAGDRFDPEFTPLPL
jgi:tetratricopeptide (TPR) repeat protein